MKCPTVLILVFLPVLALAGTVRETKDINLSAKDINMLVVNCGAGLLDLKGIEGLEKVKVTAEIEIEDFKKEGLQKFIEKNVRLNLTKRNKRAFLISEIQTNSLNDVEARINITIETPKELDVKITDSSGPISIRDLVGNLKIDDDSGKITIENITGSVTVDDGSGSIIIEDINGRVMITDGSGFIEAAFIKGDVYITDASGDMTIRHVDGNVTVSDGSGDIDISEVSKNVFIREAGSGELEIERVKGKVTMRE
ncbi:MAG: DUF4097 family beta strand repeat protein [Deltaproteobacteria bacterium]|nr:MAG: DUF4097 family beta strand repeat protein [Deltaproteobacteria bacterium]